MISLTSSVLVNTVLGGNVTVAYDKLVIDSIRLNPVSGNIAASIIVSSTVDTNMNPIFGDLTIDWTTKKLTLQVDRLDFYKSVSLSAGAQTAVAAIITNAQNALESGMVTLGFIDGIQSTGT